MDQEVKISEYRFNELICHEQEAMQLFESMVRVFFIEFKTGFEYWSGEPVKIRQDNTALENYLNKRLKENNIQIRGRPATVSFNSGNSLLYWSYEDTKSIDLPQ